MWTLVICGAGVDLPQRAQAIHPLQLQIQDDEVGGEAAELAGTSRLFCVANHTP
jgi:hypothetical protein